MLVGGGHAHVQVLRAFAARPLEGARLTVVAPRRRAWYSGMAPGILARAYGPEDGWVDVAALAARAGALWVRDRIVRIDPEERVVEGERCGRIPYDLLSLDVGALTAGSPPPERDARVVPIKPIEQALERIERFLERVERGAAAPRAAVVGAGAAGVEVAFALRARLRGRPGARVCLLESGPAPLPAESERARRLVRRLAARYGIELRCGTGRVEPAERGLRLGDGAHIEADLVVWAAGAGASPLLARSGMPVDARGFLLVDGALRSVARPEVFAAGDCAVQVDHPATPRAGVYAVRQGPVLAANLRAAAGAPGRLRRYRPQAGFLALLSTGDRRAILLYRGHASHGRLWWRLKDRIDRRFVERFEPPRASGPTAPPAMEMEPCGGCAAKVDAGTLRALLAECRRDDAEGVRIGLQAPDDAALVETGGPSHLALTIDGFPPPLNEPYSSGEIAAVHAASDVHAMGGRPVGALALVSVADGESAVGRAELGLLMRGIEAGLERVGARLLGGHTVGAPSLSIGLSVIGWVDPGRALPKAGATPGDVLLLTKPLGTGVLLAAARAGRCPASWIESALERMRETNAEAAAALLEAGARACTDVSGFGLLGHLREMLEAGGLGAEIGLAAVPALPGALELLALGWRSSAHAANAAALAAAERGPGVTLDEPRLALLCDPQTSGGLLAAVPPERLGALAGRLGPERIAVVGSVTDRGRVRLAAGSHPDPALDLGSTEVRLAPAVRA